MNKENPFINENEKCYMLRNNSMRNQWECVAMNDGHVCPGTCCSSYKTTEQVAEEKERCRERIRNLPADAQNYIREKYGAYR